MICRSTDIRSALRSKQRGFLLNPHRFGPPPSGDPYYANVKLLLHMDGSNGSTTFTDNSPSPKTATVFGGASISTAQSKFGGASGAFNGAGAYISYPDSDDWSWGAGDGVCELWVRANSSTPASTGDVFGQLSAAGGEGSIILRQSTGNQWMAVLNNGAGFQIVNSLASVPATTWQHAALVKEGTTFRFYLDGVEQGSLTIGNAGQIRNATDIFTIGRPGANNGNYFNGYVDDFRWTKGVARYPGGTTFTPPASAFPNF